MKIIKVEKSNCQQSIAIVVSRFNQDITQVLLDNAVKHLTQAGISDENITVVHVPGAVEIGIATLRLAKTKKYAAIITFGAVIKGETAHFEYVSNICSNACSQITVQQNIPVIYGVLNTMNKQQAIERTNGVVCDMGAEAANAALEMISVCQQIDQI